MTGFPSRSLRCILAPAVVDRVKSVAFCPTCEPVGTLHPTQHSNSAIATSVTAVNFDIFALVLIFAFFVKSVSGVSDDVCQHKASKYYEHYTAYD